MNERTIWWRILLCGLLCGLAYIVAWPFAEKLKFGIDLYGGYSLLYEIDDTGLDAGDKADLAEKVMKVLQERVDPEGVMNLVWRPVGTNRLEIQMPRPSETVLQFRAAYDRLRDQLRESNLKRGEPLTALARPPAERAAALEALVRGVESRRAKCAELVTLSDAIAAARAENKIDALNDSEEKFDAKIDEVLATNVDLGRLQTALEAPPRSKFRTEELDKILQATAEQRELIDQVVKAYDQWRARRGREGRLDDPADLQRLLRGAGVLEFRMLAEIDPADPTKFDTYRDNLRRHGPRPRPGEETYQWFEIEKPADFFRGSPDYEKNFEQIKLAQRFITERYGEKYYVLAYVLPTKVLTHRTGEADWSLVRSSMTRDDEGRPAVEFELDERGGARFDVLTRQNKDRLLCIFLDDRAVSSATIESAIRTRGIIRGTFTPKEVQELVKKLNAGSLPRKLKEPPISVRAIGPSLGRANREAGMRSARYAGIAVVAFMIVFYFYSGIIAVIALALNVVLTLAVLAALGGTLTLPGVAGLVLSVGMAVDANILINERIREELGKGTPLRTAVRLGYDRAFSAIIDSNLTTLITSSILYLIASEEIKGFGLTLGAGVVINLFTAVFLTRLFFEFMALPRIPADLVRRPPLLAAAAAVAGFVVWRLAAALTAEERRAQSISIAFGKMVIAAGVATAGLYALMWVGRFVHRLIQGRGATRLPMLKLIGVPSVNWYGLRRPFYFVSVVLTIGAVALFAGRESNKLYDIEFLGGTAAQLDLKEPGSLDETKIAAALLEAAAEMRSLGDPISAAAQIAARGTDFTLSVPGVPAARLEVFLQAALGDWIAPNGLREIDASTVNLNTRPELALNVDGTPGAEEEATRLGMRGGLRRVAAQLRSWADALADAQIQEVVSLEPGAPRGASFEVVSRVTSKEVVVDAIMSRLGDFVDISPRLTFEFVRDARRGGVEYFPVSERDLAAVTGDPALVADLSDWRGGVVMLLDKLSPPQSVESLQRRLKAMRLQPGYEQFGWRDSEVIGLKRAPGDAGLFSSVAVVVADENFVYDETADTLEGWRANLAEPEVRLLRDALERQTSLTKITQFAPQVAQESKTKAIIALALSWIAIILYVWFRFGSVRWGTAAVAALIHDVLVAVGMVAAAAFIAGTPVGRTLLVEAFRVDLAMVAALLTVIGYSVNDTIIVFDRIRENKGKSTDVTPALVTASINQTLSRTMLTSLTVILCIVIMYAVGGRGIHGFNYAMLVGILTGTYSSVFVAVPLLVALGRKKGSPGRAA